MVRLTRVPRILKGKHMSIRIQLPGTEVTEEWGESVQWVQSVSAEG